MSGTTKLGIVQNSLRLYFDAGNPSSRIKVEDKYGSFNTLKNIARNPNDVNFLTRYLQFDVNKTEPQFLNINGGVLDFNGTSNGLNLIESYGITDLDSTISFWLNIDTEPSISPYQLLYSNADVLGIHITLISNQPVIQKYDDQSFRVAETRTRLEAGNWYNYTWVGLYGYTSLVDRIYINGILDYEYVSDTSVSKYTDIRYIGTSGAANFFDGKISNFMVYDRPLSDAEVLQNYNALKYRFI